MDTKTIGWQIDGEYICNLARTWLWDEDRPYEKCEELLLNCMAGSDLSESILKDMAVQILEGRKILKGINTLTFEDDNRNIRPLSEYIQNQQYKVKLNEIEKKIESSPYLYIDSFATVMSLAKQMHLEEYTRGELIQYLIYGCRPLRRGKDSNDPLDYTGGFPNRDLDKDQYLEYGAYFLNDLRLVLEVTEGNSNIHGRDLEIKATHYWNKTLQEWRDEGLTLENMTPSQRRLYERQRRACCRFNIPFPYSEQQEAIDRIAKACKEEIDSNLLMQEIAETKVRDKETVARFIELNFEPFEPFEIEGVDSMDIGDMRELSINADDVIRNVGTADLPGKYLREYSWISPDGKWYSCPFAGHLSKSWHIIQCDKNLFLGYIKYLENRGCDKKKYSRHVLSGSATPMEYLLDIGWCEFHNPNPNLEPYPEIKRELTQAQRDAIFDVILKFKFNRDPVTGQVYDWDKLEQTESEERY
jgi:hypothetical protein